MSFLRSALLIQPLYAPTWVRSALGSGLGRGVYASAYASARIDALSAQYAPPRGQFRQSHGIVTKDHVADHVDSSRAGSKDHVEVKEMKPALPISATDPSTDPEDTLMNQLVTFQLLKKGIVKPDNLPADLDTFPFYLHPLSKRELRQATAGSENTAMKKFFVLLSPMKKSEAYLNDVVSALAKSLDASYLQARIENLQAISRLQGGWARRGGRQRSPKAPYDLSQVVKQLRLAAGTRLVINLGDLNFSKCPMDQIAAIEGMLLQLYGVDVIFISTSILRSKDANVHRKALSKIPDNQFPNVVYIGGPPFSTTINILPPPNAETRALWEAQMEKKSQEEQLKINMGVLKGEWLQRSVFPESDLISDHQVSKILSNRMLGTMSAQKIIKMAAGVRVLSGASHYESLAESILLWEEGSKLMDSSRAANDPAKLAKKHEKKFLRCLTPPGKLETKFDDVGALEHHQEVLKSVISLPIERPDIFGYGVLKNSSTSILLFGPPGTGKTLLAKAVANECKANFLAVSCGDIMDMYVGESEKNVQAVFSLARKMKPCVIFLDELDALFMSRTHRQGEGSREIINQLMIEWDGVRSNNEGVVVLGATNRPFDLDEAVLRRMPRKLLVDLPKEVGRTQILTLLLKGEQLSSDVSIAELASLTKDYSGSDLKNLCVAAALSAVREQLSASKERGEPQTTTTSPPRVLNKGHFLKALKEIKASTSSESASSIELRKWDDMYGEGAKKRKQLGFGPEPLSK